MKNNILIGVLSIAGIALIWASGALIFGGPSYYRCYKVVQTIEHDSYILGGTYDCMVVIDGKARLVRDIISDQP